MFMRTVLCLLLVAAPVCAYAHFGTVIPSKSMVLEKKDASVSMQLGFLHPFEQAGMNLDIDRLEVITTDGKKEALNYKETRLLGKRGYEAVWQMKRPGLYTVAMTPKPYFEPAENKFIIHYTKTILAGFGEEEGWNVPVGMPVEIVPLTRPFALYAGSSFSGKVLVKGKPVANTIVEVEFYNKDKKYKAPNDYFVTQTVCTDDQGVFHFTAPFAGWWGFAALTQGESKIAFEGKERDVETGGVLWVEFYSPIKQ